MMRSLFVAAFLDDFILAANPKGLDSRLLLIKISCNHHRGDEKTKCEKCINHRKLLSENYTFNII